MKFTFLISDYKSNITFTIFFIMLKKYIRGKIIKKTLLNNKKDYHQTREVRY